MDEKSDERAIESLQVGARVRHARILNGMRMRDLADAVGCNESMISKIEAGKVTPSLIMLNKIVTALNRDLGSFFGLEIDAHKLVQRPEDRMVVGADALRPGKGVTYERLVPLAAGNLLEANIHVVEPGGEKSDAITHQGEAVGLSDFGRDRAHDRRRDLPTEGGLFVLLQGASAQQLSQHRHGNRPHRLG